MKKKKTHYDFNTDRLQDILQDGPGLVPRLINSLFVVAQHHTPLSPALESYLNQTNFSVSSLQGGQQLGLF